MSKIYTIAYKTTDHNGDLAYEIMQPDRAWTDKLAASRALRAMGGGKHGDYAMVLYSYNLDEEEAAAPADQEFYVTVAVIGTSYDEAHARLLELISR